jgi:hypothetical protein
MTTLRDLTARITLEAHGTEHLEHISEQLEGIHKRVELLAGVELAKVLWETVEGFSGLGEKLESAAVAAGVTTDTFQQMAYAASQNAVSQEELSGAMARYSRMIGAARDGSKEALAMFAKVGIDKSQIDTFSDASEGMQVLADRIQDIEDPIKRTQLLMGLLGRGSANMTKLMAQGGQGIRDKMVEAKTIGATVSKQNIEQLAELEDSVSSLGLVFRSAAMNLAGYFSPAIVHAIDRIKQFWIANHDIIMQDFREYANKAAFALGMVVGFIRATGEVLFEFIKTHRTLVEAVENLIIRFIEFKVAIGVIAAAFGLVAGPFKQLSEGFAVIKGTFNVVKTGMPYLMKYGKWLLGFAGDLAAVTVGVGGATGVAIMGALIVALHDAYTFLTTGNVEDMWLYKLIMAIKSLSLAALKKLGLYSPDGGVQDAKDKTMESMPLRPVGAENKGGAPIDFGHISDYRFDVQEHINDIQDAQNMPAQGPPISGGQQGPVPVSYQVDAPITVNVPANADPKAIAQAAKDGVHQAFPMILRQADQNLGQGMLR